MVCSHGGLYQSYYSKKKVTHTIATNLPANKIQALRSDFVSLPFFPLIEAAILPFLPHFW